MKKEAFRNTLSEDLSPYKNKNALMNQTLKPVQVKQSPKAEFNEIVVFHKPIEEVKEDELSFHSNLLEG